MAQEDDGIFSGFVDSVKELLGSGEAREAGEDLDTRQQRIQCGVEGGEWDPVNRKCIKASSGLDSVTTAAALGGKPGPDAGALSSSFSREGANLLADAFGRQPRPRAERAMRRFGGNNVT